MLQTSGGGLFSLRLVACHETPATGAEQEAKVVPATLVVDGINDHFIVEEAGDETDRRDEPMEQPVQETVRLAGEAILDGLGGGTGIEQAGKGGEESQDPKLGNESVFHKVEFLNRHIGVEKYDFHQTR